MRLHKRLMSVLLILVMLLALPLSIFAANYSGENVYVGLSGIQPNDTITFTENTQWATLTAVWGVRVRFLDWDDKEIISVSAAEGKSVSAPTPPTRAGYTFTGWTRIDSSAGSANLEGNIVSNIHGPSTLVYKANYKAVLADGQTTGTITVINTTHNNDYAGYRILDAEINPEDTGAVIYTIREDSPWYEFVQDYFVLTELRKEPGESGKEITIFKADPKEGFDPKTAFENLPTTGLTPDLQTKTSDRDGVIMWDEVPFGYYAITSSLGSWVTVSTNNPFATVIDKNQSPKIDKNIVDASGKKKTGDASFGDSVNFDIEVKASNYKATELITYYHIKDTISDGFDYDFTDSSNVVVTVTGTQDPISTRRLTEVSSLDALKAADSGYVFLYDKASPRTFEVVVKWAALNGKGKLMPISADEFSIIDVTYSATVSNDAVIAGSINPNTASFTYDKTSGFDPENPPTQEAAPGENSENPQAIVTTTHYVYALAIEKVDANDKMKHLTGVRFTTADFRAAKVSDGVYEVIADDDTTSVAAEYFEVPESGYILIKGLGSGAYKFFETYTLPGYNLLPPEGFTITIAPASSTGYISAGIVYGTDCAQIETVENSTGTVLPSTGGIGTTIFFVSGSILALTAGILLVTKKCMATEKQKK